MKRDYAHDILGLIQTRWSPRAFSSEKINRDDLMALFEAARYAPSCFNEQPWRFIVASTEEELAVMQDLLVESNRVWAKAAPVLMLILSKKTFNLDNKDNYWHMFDAGTAWGYFSLEAERRGLITHAMGGFSRKKAHDVYNIPEGYSVIAIVAVGKAGNPADLPEELREREEPALRNSLNSLFFNR